VAYCVHPNGPPVYHAQGNFFLDLRLTVLVVFAIGGERFARPTYGHVGTYPLLIRLLRGNPRAFNVKQIPAHFIDLSLSSFLSSCSWHV